MKKLSENIEIYWNKYSNLGVKEVMTLSEQKKIVLMNQLAMILFLVFETMQIISDIFYVQLTIASHLSILLILYTLRSNYLGYYLRSGLMMSLLTPFFIVLFSIIGKRLGQSEVPLHAYLFSRMLLLSTITLPIIFIDKKHKIALILSILFILTCIFSLNSIEKLFEVSVFDVKLELNSFYLVNYFTVFPLAIILLGLLFLNGINEKYEEKILGFIAQLEQTNDNLNDSITYASRIQSAVLPDLKNFEPYESFVFYQPRHIVSGDFYWVQSKNNKMIIVAADCTGHGVPGAFVSMLGISLLNELLAKFENQTTAEILEDLRSNVKNLLSKNEQNKSTKDGMDLAICIIDKQLNTLQFSGANNPIILIKNNELSVLKPTKNPIGIYPKERPFETTVVKIEKGDIIYMFSDGFIDQFGGEKNDKYKMPRFKDFLLSINKNTMNKQYTLLKNEFDAWHENKEQIDDVLVMGIRF